MLHLLVLLCLYFLPTIVAAQRGHGVVGIFMLNFILGWTGIGWIAMLLWALLSDPCYCVRYPAPYYPYWRR